jgi:tetratricopeptide (TPR) repeat protein
MKTHYDVLGVPPNADRETIRAAYRKLVKANHPDLHVGDEAAALRSKQVITAYAVLKDQGKRARYDKHLRRRRGRGRLLVFTVLVSAGLVSGSTLLLLNFLLKPMVNAPVARITGAGATGVAIADHGAPAATKTPALSPAEIDEAIAAESPTPSPPERAPAPSASETAWLAIEKTGNVADIWLFIRDHAGTPQAALAEKRLEPLIDAIDDIATLKALAAKLTGGSAERVRDRIERFARANEGITGALPEQTSNAPRSGAAQVAVAAAAAPMPKFERAPDSGGRMAASDPQGSGHRALSLMSRGEYMMTTPISRDRAPITHGNAKYYLHRAALWAGKGELDRALTDYDAAILLDGVNIAALHGRGLLRWRRGEVELALADFDHAIRLSFADPKIYLDRGMIWYERGRYDRAIADFNQAIRLAPYLANAYWYRSTAFRRKGEFGSAIADLNQAIQLNPAIADIYSKLDPLLTARDGAAEAQSEMAR